MLRRIVISLCAGLTSSVLAAPVPKEDDTARVNRIYGTPEDFVEPDHFEMAGEKLRVFVGVPDSLGQQKVAPVTDMKPFGASRVWRDVKGDFTVTARVVFAGKAERLAGLVVWGDAKNHAEVFRHGKSGEKLDQRVSQPDSWSDKMEQFETPPAELFLRLRLEKRIVTGEYSHDGKKWIELSSIPVTKWGHSFKVGLFVKNKSSKGSETVFDEYKLTVPKK